MDNKIKVFISSKCDGRYAHIRKKLKDKITSTKIADVYLFEKEEASTLTAKEHYKFALADCDVCIFLIDNYDGIPDGVLEEVNVVKKHNIKSLYYFCDEKTEVKTALEESLFGGSNVKFKTVHSFDDLCEMSAQALIDDIIGIYHNYCKGNLISILSEEYRENYSKINISGTEKLPDPSIPKFVLKNVDKCKNYLITFLSGMTTPDFDKEVKTSDIDDWGLQFLEVLFESKSIKQFNTSMLLNCLKELQNKQYNKLVSKRWKAIEYYFSGNIEKSIALLNEALQMAKKKNQQKWVVNDILIDLRNLNLKLNEKNNSFVDSEAQKELSNSREEIYYPIMDRIVETLNEKYVRGLYEDKIKSPYTVTFGNGFYPYGELLSSSYIVAFYNGSLTHLLLLYDRLKDFLFYLISKHSDWSLRLNMLKLVVFNGKEKEIKSLKDAYPEILNNLNSEDALEIMEFCKNHTIEYERFNSLLLAFGLVGYYLDEKSFEKYQSEIFSEINNWIENDNPAINVGFNIFKCIEDVYIRLNQDAIVNICNKLIINKYYYFYDEMFNMFSKAVDISKMSCDIANKLINNVCDVFEDEKGLEILKRNSRFLWKFRKQSKDLTDTLDDKVKTHFDKFYKEEYNLETTDNEEKDNPVQIKRYLKKIKESNETQGKNGTFFGHSICLIATIHSILLYSDCNYDEDLLSDIVITIADTILHSKESLNEKIHAVSLLIYIAIKYPCVFDNNKGLYESIYNQQDSIQDSSISLVNSNINIVSLKICLQFLYVVMGIEDLPYQNLLELLPFIQNDIANTLVVTTAIIKYLDTDKTVVFPNSINSIILQYTLQWLQSDSTDIRWNSTRILFALTRNPVNNSIINKQLIHLIDTDNLYIKNLIMNNIFKMDGIDASTKDYIVSKCKNDCNFVVRFVCKKQMKKHSQ